MTQETFEQLAARTYETAMGQELRPQDKAGVLKVLAAFRDELAKGQEPVVIEAPNYHDEAMGCGLEDRGITDRYEAMRYGFDCAVERMLEQIPDEPLYTHPFVAAPAESAFPERDTSRPAEDQGLFRKFDVRRLDGSSAPGGKHHNCRYFVLDLDHDKHAPAAMRAYAADCQATHPQLSAELAAEFGAVAAPAGVPEDFTEVMAAVFRELEHREENSGNAPGHGHDVPGVWDSDNGALAGQTCAWCALWNKAKAMLATSTQAAPADAVAKDAERYRWLRENWTTMNSVATRNTLKLVIGGDKWADFGTEVIDAAIDAAMQGKESGNV